MNTLFLGCGKMGSIILNNMISEKSVKASKTIILRKVAKDDIKGVKTYTNIEDLSKKSYKADIVFIGPETPLVLGLKDRFSELGIMAFGPTAKAAQLEGSKKFSRNLYPAFHFKAISVFDFILFFIIILELLTYVF